MFDVNDFDETLPGPFEWDVKRLAASLAVAGRGQRVRHEGWPQDRLGGSVPIERLRPEGLTIYAHLCGWTLARAHARSGDRVALAAYLGGSTKFSHAIAGFAETYADQNERDYASFQRAVNEGGVEATSEI